jgi:hypothetical protein
LNTLRGNEPSTPDPIAVRAARAKLIEQTCLKLTDQLTVIHGQAQILSEKLPADLREDLLRIRNAVMKGMEFNSVCLRRPMNVSKKSALETVKPLLKIASDSVSHFRRQVALRVVDQLTN